LALSISFIERPRSLESALAGIHTGVINRFGLRASFFVHRLNIFQSAQRKGTLDSPLQAVPFSAASSPMIQPVGLFFFFFGMGWSRSSVLTWIVYRFEQVVAGRFIDVGAVRNQEYRSAKR